MQFVFKMGKRQSGELGTMLYDDSSTFTQVFQQKTVVIKMINVGGWVVGPAGGRQKLVCRA